MWSETRECVKETVSEAVLPRASGGFGWPSLGRAPEDEPLRRIDVLLFDQSRPSYASPQQMNAPAILLIRVRGTRMHRCARRPPG